MKSRLLALALAVTLLASCSLLSQPWVEFTSPDGSFSASFPETPEEQTQSIDTAAGPITLHGFTVDRGYIAYAVMYSDFPSDLIQQGDPDLLLDGGVDGAVTNVQGNLVSKTTISLDGHPGREFTIESDAQQVTVKGRIFLVDNRLYQVIVVIAEGGSFESETAKFLDSFTLVR